MHACTHAHIHTVLLRLHDLLGHIGDVGWHIPQSLGPAPQPVDNSRKAEKYELRIVVWNTTDVVLGETSIVTGEQMSDIYVKE